MMKKIYCSLRYRCGLLQIAEFEYKKKKKKRLWTPRGSDAHATRCHPTHSKYLNRGVPADCTLCRAAPQCRDLGAWKMGEKSDIRRIKNIEIQNSYDPGAHLAISYAPTHITTIVSSYSPRWRHEKSLRVSFTSFFHPPPPFFCTQPIGLSVILFFRPHPLTTIHPFSYSYLSLSFTWEFETGVSWIYQIQLVGSNLRWKIKR